MKQRAGQVRGCVVKLCRAHLSSDPPTPGQAECGLPDALTAMPPDAVLCSGSNGVYNRHSRLLLRLTSVLDKQPQEVSLCPRDSARHRLRMPRKLLRGESSGAKGQDAQDSLVVCTICHQNRHLFLRAHGVSVPVVCVRRCVPAVVIELGEQWPRWYHGTTQSIDHAHSQLDTNQQIVLCALCVQQARPLWPTRCFRSSC